MKNGHHISRSLSPSRPTTVQNLQIFSWVSHKIKKSSKSSQLRGWKYTMVCIFLWKIINQFSPTSESDSNSDSDISGKKVKELKLLPSGSSKKEMTPRRLTKGPELLNTSTNHTATSCSPLNLQVIKSPTIVTSSSALAYHSSPGSSSYSLASPLGNVYVESVKSNQVLSVMCCRREWHERFKKLQIKEIG